MAETHSDEQAIFEVARNIESVDARQSYLRQMCGEDLALEQRVQALLRAYEESASFLESPPPELGTAPTIDQPITEKPGTQIGPYKLLQQVGEGGMGVVYMAEQKEPVKRRVALKIIRPGMDTRQVIARFEAERQALAMMDHPNIAKVLDAGQTDSGRPYFVMELVKGVPVTQYCDEQHLTPKERLELFVPICQAVQHAHQKGIIHRDLKPSNVLVALYDGQAVPKVIDFGVAKATSQTLTEKTMFTQLGQVVGTLEYMSPEQAQVNQLDVDTRSDIYSLGVLLYELLTGDTPFDRTRLRSAAFDEMLRIIREEEPPKPSTKISSSQSLPSVAANRHVDPQRLTSSVRGELDWIVMKALEKDRARRYETASKFAEDVQHYLNDETVVACPPSVAYRFHKFARRNRAAILVASLVAAVLLLGIVATSWQAVRATLAEKQIRAEQGRTSKERDRAKSAEARAADEAETARQAAASERAARLEAVRHLYDAHMTSAQLAHASHQRGRVLDLLSLYQSPPASGEEDLRAFEWYHWWTQSHRYDYHLPQSAHDIAVSPDGSMIATAQRENSNWTVKVWSVTTGELIVTLRPENTESSFGSSLGIAFSPDGKMIAAQAAVTGGNSGPTWSLRLWDLSAPRRERMLHQVGKEHFESIERNNPNWVGSTYRRGGGEILFSPNGSTLTALPSLDSMHEPPLVRIWNTATGEIESTLRPRGDGLLGYPSKSSNEVYAVAYSSDGASLAIGGTDEEGSNLVQIWDIATGRIRSTLQVPEDGGTRALRFLPGGTRLLGYTGKKFIGWDLEKNEIVESWDGPPRATLSPDGQFAAVEGQREIELWDIAHKARLADLIGHVQREYGTPSIAFSHSGRHLVSASEDGIRLWDLTTDRLHRDYLSIPDISNYPTFNLFAFSPNSRTLACCNKSGGIDLWNAATFQLSRRLATGYYGRAHAVSFAPDGRTLATAGRDPATRRIRIDLHDMTSSSSRRIGEHANLLVSLEFSGTGRRLASVDKTGCLRVWNVDSGSAELSAPEQLPEEKDFAWTHGLASNGDVCFTPDGSRLVMAEANQSGPLRIWSLSERTVELEVAPKRSTKAVACSKTAPLLAFSDGSKIRLMDTETWKGIGQLEGHSGSIASLAFSPDGNRLASASPNEIIVWNITTESPVLTFDIGDKTVFGSLAFSPDGAMLAAAGDGTLRVYRAATETDVARGHLQPYPVSELDKAEHYRDRGQWDRAIAHYDLSIEQHPDDDRAWKGRAICNLEAGHLDAALEDHQRLIPLWKKFGVAQSTQLAASKQLNRVAKLYRQREQAAKAKEVLKLVVRIVEITQDEAVHLRKRDPAIAYRYHQTLRTAAIGHYNLAKVLDPKHEKTQAVFHFRKSLELVLLLAPLWSSKREAALQYSIRSNLGILLKSDGRLDEAESEFLKCIELDPAKEAAPFNLASVYLQRKQPERAIALMDERKVTWSALRGRALRQLGKLDEAITCLRQGLEEYKSTPDRLQTCRLNLAVTLLDKVCEAALHRERANEELSRSEDLVREALNVTPGNGVRGWAVLGLVQYRQGKLDEAKKSLDKVMGINPDHAFGLLTLSMIAWDAGDKETALEHWRKSADALPKQKTANKYVEKLRLEVKALITPPDQTSGGE